MTKVRCAIYTRKSSDEGLEQSFNSLDAQRAACSAYVASQASEGWCELPALYDDGGLSGGTLERPALQRMLADVAAGLIDIVVVYKVDRLSRSLLDFAKLVEAFDKASVSFVSITQSFNTTTSMGRLTLNMLLSFAQFERDVTAERIRDKIAASKARGMWMGGIVPLGYRPDGRSLAIVEEHAALVRHIFERYLALGNVRLLAEELQRDQIGVPRRMTGSGRPLGGGWFSRGLLHLMLRRVTYDGRIAHGDKAYAGSHPAIVDQDVFMRVQAMLADHVQGARTGPRKSAPSLLAGRICDEASEPLTPVHSTRGARRYRYYVSRGLQHKTSATGIRIPAREIETLVIIKLAELFEDPLALIDRTALDVPAHRLTATHALCHDIAVRLREGRTEDVGALVTEVRITSDGVAITISTAGIAGLLDVASYHPAASDLIEHVSVQLKRSGRAMRLVDDNGGRPAPAPDRALIKQLLQARRWWTELKRGELDITALAARDGVTPSYITRIVRLAFLSPSVVSAILAGKGAAHVSVAALTLGKPPAPRWADQEAALLVAQP